MTTEESKQPSQEKNIAVKKDKLENNKPAAYENDAVNIIPPEILAAIPAEHRKTLTTFISTSIRRQRHPLLDKFTPESVHKFLDICQNDDNNRFKLAWSKRHHNVLYTVLAIGTLMFFTYFLLPDHKDILMNIIIFLCGLGGGYGIGYAKKTR